MPQIEGGAVVDEVTEKISVKQRPALVETSPVRPVSPPRVEVVVTVEVDGPVI